MNTRLDFNALADALCVGLAHGEALFLRLVGEDSDFVRISRARVRQAGRVTQRRLGLALVSGRRQAESWLDLGGDPTDDLRRAGDALIGLRALLPFLPEDPYINWQRSAERHEHCDADRLPVATTALEQALSAAEGLDLVGLWASGAMHRGFASSHGQRAWHTASACSLDWSCHRSDGHAIKGLRAGTSWDAAGWRTDMERARQELGGFDRPIRRLEPGLYRTFLEPAAVHELCSLLAWDGFSAKARRSGSSPLMRLESGQSRFSPLVTMYEDAADGLAPLISDHGFPLPDRVMLIDSGRNVAALVSARTAEEFALPVNANCESPDSLRLAPGNLPRAEALRALGTGLWIGNLHYLNYSDLSACRITGMTRFACWWVEDGELVAPIEHLRFDDDIYGLLGDRLEALTREVELIPDTETYDERSLATWQGPGALLGGMRFTL